MEPYMLADFPVEASFEDMKEKLLLEEGEDIQMMAEKFSQAKDIFTRGFESGIMIEIKKI